MGIDIIDLAEHEEKTAIFSTILGSNR